MQQFLVWSGVVFWCVVLAWVLWRAAGWTLERFAHRLPPYPVLAATLGSLPVMLRRAWQAREIATTWQDRKGSPSRR
jgi:hypothetical protein